MSKGNEPRKGSMLEVTHYTEKTVRRARRYKKRPCGSDAPLAPTGLSLTFDSTHKTRHKHWRADLTWDEVTTNEYGADTTCDRYVVQLQHSTDGATPLGNTRRFLVNAKDDDADTTVTKIVGEVHRRYYYRFRVKAVNKSGCRSDWSSYTAWQQPGNEGPPAPTSVKVYNGSTDRVVVEWDAPLDPILTDELDQDIHHFQVQISVSVTFATTYKFDRFHHATRKAFKCDTTEAGGSTFYCRVRSCNSEGDKSSWVEATLAGNSTPGTTPDGVTLGAGGGGVVATFKKLGRLRVKHYANARWTNTTGRTLTFRKCRATVGDKDAGTGAPTGQAIKANLRRWVSDESSHAPVFDNGSGGDRDDRITIGAGSYKDVIGAADFDITTLADNESISVKITQVGSAFPGEDFMVQVYME